MFTNIQTNWISLKQETFNLGTMEIPKKQVLCSIFLVNSPTCVICSISNNYSAERIPYS